MKEASGLVPFAHAGGVSHRRPPGILNRYSKRVMHQPLGERPRGFPSGQPPAEGQSAEGSEL